MGDFTSRSWLVLGAGALSLAAIFAQGCGDSGDPSEFGDRTGGSSGASGGPGGPGFQDTRDADIANPSYPYNRTKNLKLLEPNI